MRTLKPLLLLLLAAPLAAQTFHDPDSGVSFRYPAGWTRTDPAASTVPVALLNSGQGAVKPLVQLTFHGPAFAHTTLDGMALTGATASGDSAAACGRYAQKTGEVVATRSVIVHGIAFLEARGGDAAMCHHLDAVIDSTYAAGRCLLVERDVATLCSGVAPGRRDLTPAQFTAIDRRLAAIFQSLVLPARK